MCAGFHIGVLVGHHAYKRSYTGPVRQSSEAPRAIWKGRVSSRCEYVGEIGARNCGYLRHQLRVAVAINTAKIFMACDTFK